MASNQLKKSGEQEKMYHHNLGHDFEYDSRSICPSNPKLTVYNNNQRLFFAEGRGTNSNVPFVLGPAFHQSAFASIHDKQVANIFFFENGYRSIQDR